MKNILILSAVIFFTVRVNAQPYELLVKNDIQNDRLNESAIKIDKRENRKELRKLKGAEVSDIAKEQFIQDFGNIPAAWERTENYDEAAFTKDGKAVTAFYDDDAQLVGTTTAKTFSDIPLKAQEYINKKYSDYKVGDIYFFDDNEFNETDMVIYNKQFDNADSYFVEVTKNNKEIILQVSNDGVVSYFLRLN